LSVTFTPTDTVDYATQTAMVTLVVNKATPIITWANPAPITYPTHFGPAQETATASVPGTFKYSPKAGDLEDPGPAKGLSVTFTPTDTTDYNTASATVYITINKGTPTATWAPPPLTYGQGLTAARLNAVASVPGTFTYFDALGTIFTAGTHTLNATFHPTNGPDYNELTSVTAILTVNVATPTITWPTPAAITYGTPLGATQLDATSDVRGDLSYAPAAGTMLSAGSQTLSVTFTPTEHTADYTTATATVPLIVNKANPTVSVSCAPNPITYGPQNTSCTATVSGSATGSLTWTINGGAWTITPVTAPTAGGFSGYPVGSYTIAVAYSGDSNNIGSSSSTVLTILPAPTTTTIASSVNPTVLGQNVSWPCSVTSPDGTPTGMITYTLDGGPLGTISTTDAPWSGTGLTVGAHVLSCSFAAQGNFAASSGTVTQAVGIASTVTELSSSANPIVFGGSATFTALVDTGGSVAPTASVAFTSNGVAIGSAVVSTVTTTNLLNNSDVSTWTASGPTLTANASAAPDGTLTATHVVFPANSGCCINLGMTSPSAWIPGDTYTYSVWLRSDSSASVNVSLRTGPGGESDTWPTMTPTWTRYTVSGTVPAGATGNVTALMYLADTPGVDYYAWGAQVEQSATAGPYIATNGAPATGTGGVATLTTTTLQAGSDTIVATYGGDAGTGTSTSNPLIEGVTAATPTITWNNPAPIVYGTPLSGTQLNATASVPGSFTYSPVAGTVLSAGSQTLSVTFVPTDSADYSTQTATVTLVVNKATLTITPNPALRVYGAANPVFTGTVAGLVPGDDISVGYTSAATPTTPVGAYSSGPNAISSTTSGPVNELGNYNYVQSLGTLTITQATTVLTWPTPAAITYGTPLSATQLNATSGGGVGRFAYTPAAGTVLAVGTQTLSVVFTPTDGADYSSATATVSLTVNKTPLTVTPNPSSKVYGTANPVFTGSIAGLVAGDTITASYASAATTTTAVGVYSSGVNAISATLSDPGNKLANYTLTQNVGTLTITQSTTVLTWATPAAITYGTALSSTQLDATAGGVAGVFVYSPLAGTVLSAGTHTLKVTFTPSDGTDYSTATASVTLMVNPAVLTVTPAPSSKVYGTANPAFTGSITGMIPGDGITATYSSAATTTTPVGVYPTGPNAIAAALSDPGSKLGNYTLNQTVGAFTITQATTVLTWATPAAITYETPLSVTQLDATSGGVIGTYLYTPAAGTILTAGTHTLSVAFTPSDAVDYSSASATVSLTVNKVTPTVLLTSSANPTVYGGSVTFTAQTTTSTTGTMTFYDGAAIIGTGTLSGGVATFTVNSLGAGTHSITASYAGDSNYLSAVSAAVSQIVTRAPVTITVTSSLNPSSFGQSVTFTFTVAGVSGLATPTGTIAFSDGSTLLASPTLNASGVATYTTVMLSGGSHTLSAVFGGDANYQ
jgi:hypothetical protein